MSDAAQLVSPGPLHRVPVGSTLLWGERGAQCQRFTPLHLAGGQRDRGYVCLCHTKMYHAEPETMALSQLNYIALFYDLTHPVPLFTFKFELPRGKIYNLGLLF